MKRCSAILVLLLNLVLVHAQHVTNWDSITLAEKLSLDVRFLADDRLEGRGTGTKGEKLAYRYIIKDFKASGLKPAGSDGWLQPFEVTASITLKKFTCSFNGKAIDARPAGFTGEGKVIEAEMVDCGKGISVEKGEDFAGKVLTGKVAIIQAAWPEPGNPHSALNARHDLESRVKKAHQLGAVGVVFYASDSTMELPNAKFRRSGGLPIPVITLNGITATPPTGKISLNVRLNRAVRIGHNVIAMLDRGAATTVVIGAHYDHLGFGETGGSLHAGHEHDKAIHNGADDNASGTAGLLALAARLAKQNDLKQNYLFIAFSGEEMGLLGSNFYTKNSTIDLKQVSYMFNMDMIGRLKIPENILGLQGIGTSPVWNEVIDTTGQTGLRVKTSASGTGASDHTSFYLKDLPVIHFFSGTHTDYHKPSDDWEKINVGGMVMILRYMDRMIQQLDTRGKLPFTKTKDEESSPRQLKVTLGIMPDYMYEKEGIKVDGVSPGKPGDKAGLKAGDVILQLGEHRVPDMQGYMKVLGLLKKGETVPCEIIREGKKMVINVTF